MKFVYSFFIFSFSLFSQAQELFVVTDPASNVPANSLAVNAMQSLFKEEYKSGYSYHIMPEVTYGLNKNLMFRTTSFVSNGVSGLNFEGAGLYAKYRFFSSDDLNSHFRLAAYGRYSFNNSDIHQEQIEIMGHNTGYETGLVATKLIKKTALSINISYEQALDNGF